MDTLRILLLIAVSVTWIGCASGGNGAPAGDETASAKAPAAMPAGYSEPPAGSKLAKVQVGWNEVEVRKALGEPDSSNAYQTGKGWIPFYYGPDTHRTDWMYRGQGRVVFSRNRYSGALKVIRVLYNPSELK